MGRWDAYGAHQAVLFGRGEGYAGEYDADFRREQFCGAAVGHDAGVFRDGILCGGGVFWVRVHPQYAVFDPGDVAGGTGECGE